jgi:uncharacterized protein YneR
MGISKMTKEKELDNMEIVLSDSALNWFKEEIGLKNGDKVRFYPQFYGNSPIQPGYSLAFSKDTTPNNIAVQTEKDGILFFVEDDDLWFFKDHNLHIDYNEKDDEVEFSYIK